MQDNQKEIQELVDDLSEELQAQKPMAHPAQRFALSGLAVLAYLAVVLFFSGVRVDAIEKLGQVSFLLEIALFLGLFVTAGAASMWLSHPDIRQQNWILRIPYILLAGVVAWFGWHGFVEKGLIAHLDYHHCMTDTLMIVSVPVAALIFISRKGASTHPYLSALMCTASAGAVAWLAMRFVCSVDIVTHTFSAHFLPFVLLGALMGMLARRLYRW